MNWEKETFVLTFEKSGNAFALGCRAGPLCHYTVYVSTQNTKSEYKAPTFSFFLNCRIKH